MKITFAAIILGFVFLAHGFAQDATPSPTPHKKYDSGKKPAVVHRTNADDGSASPTPTPHSTKKKVSKRPAVSDDAEAHASPASKPASTPSPEQKPGMEKLPSAPDASLAGDELVEFDRQPARVRKLIESALALTRLNLTYTYGSDEPDNGGMDCSGFIYYVLRENGFDDVPRDASGQYVWVRKAKTFQAVLSTRQDSFEFDDLRPGDLLFWTGTYDVKRDPPVTHTMIYLGTEKATGKPVMVGSTDGRSYRGKSRWGVSVFDFKANTIPPTDGPQKKMHAVFAGYARIPGMATKSLLPLP